MSICIEVINYSLCHYQPLVSNCAHRASMKTTSSLHLYYFDSLNYLFFFFFSHKEKERESSSFSQQWLTKTHFKHAFFSSSYPSISSLSKHNISLTRRLMLSTWTNPPCLYLTLITSNGTLPRSTL